MRTSFVSAIFFVFLVLPIAYSQDARSDFHAKYAERCGSAQGRAFWGSRNQYDQYIKFYPRFTPKPPILGPIFDLFFSAEKPPNDKPLPDKQPLIVAGAP